MNPKAREKEGRLNIYGFNDWEFPKINDRQVTDSSNTKQDKHQEKQLPSKPIFKLLETLKGRKEKETHAHTWSFTHFTHRVAEDSDLSTETMEPKSSKATFHNEERRRKSKTKSRNVWLYIYII